MAHPANQIPSQSVLIKDGETAFFRLPASLDDADNPISYITGDHAYAIYCLADATVYVIGGIIVPGGTDNVFEQPSTEVEVSLSAGMTIYGRFNRVRVAGTGAQVLAYV